jgi:hypothetical protein
MFTCLQINLSTSLIHDSRTEHHILKSGFSHAPVYSFPLRLGAFAEDVGFNGSLAAATGFSSSNFDLLEFLLSACCKPCIFDMLTS